MVEHVVQLLERKFDIEPTKSCPSPVETEPLLYSFLKSVTRVDDDDGGGMDTMMPSAQVFATRILVCTLGPEKNNHYVFQEGVALQKLFHVDEVVM